jgi:hypothetical protein
VLRASEANQSVGSTLNGQTEIEACGPPSFAQFCVRCVSHNVTPLELKHFPQALLSSTNKRIYRFTILAGDEKALMLGKRLRSPHMHVDIAVTAWSLDNGAHIVDQPSHVCSAGTIGYKTKFEKLYFASVEPKKKCVRS